MGTSSRPTYLHVPSPDFEADLDYAASTQP